MTESELSAIESRANAATPGPWKDTYDYMILGADGVLVGSGAGRANRDFIQHAREDVPVLIAELRRRDTTLTTLLSIASDAVTSLEEADYYATAAKLRDALRAFG